MNKQKLPRTIDPIRFAEQRLVLEGTLLLKAMKRLSAECFPGEALGEVAVWLEGGVDNQGFRYLHGMAETDVPLQCQRCLKPMEYHLKTEFYLSPVKDEGKVEDIPNNYEALIYPNEQISLLEFVEDELLLMLPLVAKHCEKDCTIDLPSERNMVNSAAQKDSPFAELAKLKKNQEVK